MNNSSGHMHAEDELLEETVQKAESAGVTWMLEGIYGLRYGTEQALKRVIISPPQIARTFVPL